MTSRQTNVGSRPAARSTNRADNAAREEIIKMLKDDHKRVKKLFREFEKSTERDDAEKMRSLVTEACNELEVHTAIEEEIVYPTVRECLTEQMLVDEAEVEHMSAKQLIQQLRDMQPQDDKYAATFKVLGEYVKHHIREEEGEMFEQLSSARMDWARLHGEIAERREVLIGQYFAEPQVADGSGMLAEKSDGEDLDDEADDEILPENK